LICGLKTTMKTRTISASPAVPNSLPTPPGTGGLLPTQSLKHEQSDFDDDNSMDLPALTLPSAAIPPEHMFPPPPSRACTMIHTIPSDLSEKKTDKPRKRTRKDNSELDAEQRKKARRTSHSDIERRRRLKINEQFEELRQLVPACSQLSTAKRGGDLGLHKLDILQESVAFIKHLTECMASIEKRLQSQNHSQNPEQAIRSSQRHMFQAVSPAIVSSVSSTAPSSAEPSAAPSPLLSPTDTSKLRIANLVG
jgi:hypothetical protein